MEIQDRRNLLATNLSPKTNHEIVVELEKLIFFEEDKSLACIRIMYVPDRLILPHQSLQTYLDAISKVPVNSLEELAVAMLDDFINEVLPRWVQINISVQDKNAIDRVSGRITVTDRQPGWENSNLLSRITC